MQPVGHEAPSSRGSCLREAPGKLLHPAHQELCASGGSEAAPQRKPVWAANMVPLESTHTRECLLWSRSWVKQTQTLKQRDSLGLQRAPVWSSLIVAGTEQGSLLPLQAGKPKVLLCGRLRPTLSSQHGLQLTSHLAPGIPLPASLSIKQTDDKDHESCVLYKDYLPEKSPQPKCHYLKWRAQGHRASKRSAHPCTPTQDSTLQGGP